MKLNQTPRKLLSQTGLTLVELMVALAISSILMVGISNIYSSSKQAYKINDEFSILQENARLAFHFLILDIRMAGYIGCAWSTGDNVDSVLNTANLSAAQIAFLNFGTGIEGYEANNTGPNTTLNLQTGAATGFNRTVNVLFTGHVDGSDILVIRRAFGKGVKLSGNKNSANLTILDGGTNSIVDYCHEPSKICVSDLLMVSDCSKARIFQATDLEPIVGGSIQITHAASGFPGNNPASWGGNSADPTTWFAPADSEVLKYSAHAYFVAPGSSGQPTLKRLTNLDATPEELIEGVENMQILYGTDTNGDGKANQYGVAPVAITNDVVSVRISLLMSTPGEIPRRNNDTKTYNMLSENNAVNVRVTPTADRRIRKVFTSTIKLRSKGLTNE